jgi:excisionase family DNA binding protein
MTAATKRKMTPPEVAKLWGVSLDKITYWIASGDLRAIDASTKRGQRPRYLIDSSDLEAFEKSRAIVPAGGSE